MIALRTAFRLCYTRRMRRGKRSTVLSALLAGTAITMFVLFVLSSSIIALVVAFVLLVASGYARKRVSYDQYRDEYEQRFGMREEEHDAGEE